MLWLLLAACNGDPIDADPDTERDSDTEVDAWLPVGEALDQAYAGQDIGIEGLRLTVWNDADEVVFDHVAGTLDRDERLSVASASKLVSALVLLRLVHDGDLARSDTTGAVLSWPADRDAITLDHLGAFVSGLTSNAPCTYVPGLTLSQCVDRIAASPLEAAPAERFDYGSTHLHVAAGMAEAVTSTSWNDLFHARLAAPLGLDDDDLVYYTLPKQQRGTSNPLVAGGLRATMNEYARFLALILDDGVLDGTRLVNSADIDRMYTDAYPDVLVVDSPAADLGMDFRYGFGCWLECDEAVCDRISSAGAYGFTPWVDREHGYHAILAMESPDAGTGSAFSFPLQQTLLRDIEAALSR